MGAAVFRVLKSLKSSNSEIKMETLEAGWIWDPKMNSLPFSVLHIGTNCIFRASFV